jgi:hypothetical protein
MFGSVSVMSPNPPTQDAKALFEEVIESDSNSPSPAVAPLRAPAAARR